MTCLTFLETVQLDRLHYFLPKILALWVELLKWGRRNGNPYTVKHLIDWLMLTGRLGDRETGRGIDGFYQNLKVCNLNAHQLSLRPNLDGYSYNS
ncbi:MAG TPA: hypothetical protein V6C85_31465 [Allocoleopsis sp.]